MMVPRRLSPQALATLLAQAEQFAEFGAQPWSPLDPPDDSRPPGARQLRGQIGNLNLRLGPGLGEEGIWDTGP